MSESLFFLGLLPPPELETEVTELKKMVARDYDSRHALKSPAHITLFPPFWFDEEKIYMLYDTLKVFATTRSKIHIHLDGFGCFKPRVIFIEVLESVDLNRMHNELKDNLKKEWNLEGDSRPQFHPHMTIAFKDLSNRAFYVAWDYFRNSAFQRSFLVEELVLLKHQRGVWKIDSEFTLSSNIDQT